MSDLQAIADRVQIEALRGEATDAAMMRDYDRVASLFTHYAIYHDRYRRTGDGWKFTERSYEIRYLDHSPLTGWAPTQGTLAGPPATGTTASPDSSRPAVMEEEVR
jgi:hypothetical protein